jgi:sugar transferase (PEP-CTERM/EpsH1 system associated)
MKILFLTSRIPFPPHRGDKLKIWNLMHQLSRRHEIYLLTFVKSESERAASSHLREVCREVRTVTLPVARSLMNCLVGAANHDPFQVHYYRSKRMASLVREEIARIRPDVIHTHLIRMAHYTASEQNIPVVLDLTDAVSLYLSRFRGAQKNPLAKWLLGLELKRMVRYESIISCFDRGLVCSNTDREFLLRGNPKLPLSLLPNGVDLETFSSPAPPSPEPGRIIFTGNLSYFPNVDAACFLVREILPKIQKDVPTVKVYIVGQNPSSKVRALAGRDVIVTGYVDDIRAEYLKSSVAVSPVRFGAGTLNKVLEPLALGVPVVTTSIGLEGLCLEPGNDLLVADTAEKFAGAVTRLLTNDGDRMSMAARASEKVRARFSWEKIARDLEQIYEEIVS